MRDRFAKKIQVKSGEQSITNIVGRNDRERTT